MAKTKGIRNCAIGSLGDMGPIGHWEVFKLCRVAISLTVRLCYHELECTEWAGKRAAECTLIIGAVSAHPSSIVDDHPQNHSNLHAGKSKQCGARK